MKQPNVSREITVLREMGLIEPKSTGNSTVYRKTKIDKVIGLSRELTKMIGSNDQSAVEATTSEEQTTNGNNNII